MKEDGVGEGAERALDADFLLLEGGLVVELHQRLVAAGGVVGKHCLVNSGAQVRAQRGGVGEVGGEALLGLVNDGLVAV